MIHFHVIPSSFVERKYVPNMGNLVSREGKIWDILVMSLSSDLCSASVPAVLYAKSD